MLLIHPPIAKPSEPPAGLARILGALQAHNIDCALLDANIEGMLFLMHSLTGASDTWTRRALKNLGDNLEAIRNPATYANASRYTQVVTEMNRVLAMAARPHGVTLSLTDYQDPDLSPVRSGDLLRGAEVPERNPFFAYFAQRIPPLLESRGTATVGISLSYLSQALCAFALIGFLRKTDPGLRIILGGSLITSWMSNPAWKNPFGGLVDEVVAGPGEEWLVAHRLGPDAPARDGGRYTPCYDPFPRDAYCSPGLVLPYSASNGCYWRKCSFCPESAEKNPYAPLPAAAVLDDIAHCSLRGKPALLHFLDNAMSPTLLRGIAEHGTGTPWYGFARIDGQLADRDFCHALRRSGCVMLKLGLESGDQGILDNLGKGIDLATASRALHGLHDAGIAVFVYLLFGTVLETIDEARNTLAFAVRHAGCIDYLNLAVFNLPAYGPDVDNLRVSRFYEGDLSLYAGFEHPKGWGRQRVRQFLADEFRKDPAIARILRSTPPLFTSNHAPFLRMHASL